MLLSKLKSAGRNAFDRLVDARQRQAASHVAALRNSRIDL